MIYEVTCVLCFIAGAYMAYLRKEQRLLKVKFLELEGCLENAEFKAQLVKIEFDEKLRSLDKRYIIRRKKDKPVTDPKETTKETKLRSIYFIPDKP